MGLPFRRADAEKTLRAVAAEGNAQAKAILHVELLFRVVAKEGGEELRSDPGERSRTTAEPGPCCRSSYATAEKPRHLAGAALHHPANGLVACFTRALEKARSEERRAGKECVRTCRSRGAPSN